MSGPNRGTMARFCRRGRFFRAHGGKLLAAPGGLDDLSPTVPVEKTIAGPGLASGASIASGGLESNFWRLRPWRCCCLSFQ